MCISPKGCDARGDLTHGVFGQADDEGAFPVLGQRRQHVAEAAVEQEFAHLARQSEPLLLTLIHDATSSCILPCFR